MRLDKVYIDGFKNLKDVTVDFDPSRLTSVIIGQNGTGKSNLIEAVVDIFRFVDLNRGAPHYKYKIEYRIDGKSVALSNLKGKSRIDVDGKQISRKTFDEDREQFFPDLVFGYYSGGSRKLERLFDSHQRRYYDAIKLEGDSLRCDEALKARRLFYCRPIHGVLALLSLFAFPDEKVTQLLDNKVGITNYDSSMALFRVPWFAQKLTNDEKVKTANELWGAKGPAGSTARSIQKSAFHPIGLQGNAIDDYRDKQQSETQYACFLKDETALSNLAENYKSDSELFYALEAVDISDLVREIFVWVKRKNDESGDIGFADLSDGERQLLMVLGLLRVARGKRALFLLDEPDTHLNPAWQHAYLDLIREWTQQTSDTDKCHIILTSHNPLTIAALDRSEVRVMQVDEGKTIVTPPYTDPKGMGFTATLTEIFGMPSSLDANTQKMLDDRNVLVRIEKRNDLQEQQLMEISEKIDRLGFMFENREPLYQDFLRALQNVRYANKPVMTQKQLASKQQAMSELIKQLMTEKKEVAP